jgi:peptide-methionine (S)-S-oxide reductase
MLPSPCLEVFDPQKLSYARLLEFFFQRTIPTISNQQGNDLRTSYRSAIFYTTDDQRRLPKKRLPT